MLNIGKNVLAFISVRHHVKVTHNPIATSIATDVKLITVAEEDSRIVTISAVNGIITKTRNEPVVARTTIQNIAARVTNDFVVQRIARSSKVIQTRQDQVLNIG